MKKLRLDPDAVDGAGTVHVAALAITGLTCTCYGKPTCVAACITPCLGDGACTCRPP